jgi:hypothetical protein
MNRKVKHTNSRDKSGRFVSDQRRAIVRLIIGLAVALLLVSGVVKGLAVYEEYQELKKEYEQWDGTILSPVSTEKFTVKFADSKPLPWDRVAHQIIDEWADVHPNPALAKKYTMQALMVAYCESGWDGEAVNDKNTNGSIDRGVFQINSIHGYSEFALLAARTNIKIAKEMFKRNGYSWGAWVCGKGLR